MPTDLNKSARERFVRTWSAPLALLAPLLALAGGFPAVAGTLGLALRAQLTAGLEPGEFAVLWPSGWS